MSDPKTEPNKRGRQAAPSVVRGQHSIEPRRFGQLNASDKRFKKARPEQVEYHGVGAG